MTASHLAHLQSVRVRRGRVEIHLPDSSACYVAEARLKNDGLTKHLNLEQHKASKENAAPLWLRDAGSAKRGFVSVRWRVNHNERSVWFNKAFGEEVKRKLLRKKQKDDEDHALRQNTSAGAGRTPHVHLRSNLVTKS
ncbi:hypothetical protein JOM56_011731 [Amanita muscaria]